MVPIETDKQDKVDAFLAKIRSLNNPVIQDALEVFDLIKTRVDADYEKIWPVVEAKIRERVLPVEATAAANDSIDDEAAKARARWNLDEAL